MNPNDGWSRRLVVRLGVIVLSFLVFASHASAEWKEKVLYSFQGGRDGAVPAGGVVFDQRGNLYGATSEGGSGCTAGSCGTVFQLVPPPNKSGKWEEKILHDFRGSDGSIPEGSVILDAVGNVYGTTAYGGSGPRTLIGSTVGCGTVYEMLPPKQKGDPWTENVIYSFQGNKDGQFPWGDLVFDKKGNLYGATYFGGGFGNCDSPYYQHCGTIFELAVPKQKGGKWKEKVLHRFRGGADGATPNGGLVFGETGAIYGTTLSGANQDCNFGQGEIGCGMVFELSPPATKGSDWSEHVLHRFRDGDDGGQPNGSLVFDAAGRLYGTAGGGASQGEGVVFRLSGTSHGPWQDAVLYDLINDQDGAAPQAGVVFDTEGNLYGTASGGGAAGDGTVVRLRSTADGWVIAVLHTFTGAPDGSYPASKLIFDRAGNLYGTTQQSGTGQNCGNHGCGTVFEVSP